MRLAADVHSIHFSSFCEHSNFNWVVFILFEESRQLLFWSSTRSAALHRTFFLEMFEISECLLKLPKCFK